MVCYGVLLNEALIPIVFIHFASKLSSQYLLKIAVLPTPESPNIMSLNSTSGRMCRFVLDFTTADFAVECFVTDPLADNGWSVIIPDTCNLYTWTNC